MGPFRPLDVGPCARHLGSRQGGGDHDFLGIALMSAQLYWRLYPIQRKLVELRVIDGDHEWMAFRDALPETLLDIDRHCGGRR